MTRLQTLLLRSLALGLSLQLAGCAKPDKIETFLAPDRTSSYTVETHYGSGPVNADFTRVYVHMLGSGVPESQLVIDGEYLEFSSIKWVGKGEAIFCLKSGVTNTFRNEVTLRVKGQSQKIRTHLVEQCKS